MKYAAIAHWKTLTYPPMWRRGYHFALGQELVRDRYYLSTYETFHKCGGFIIVDNGAAEGDETPFNKIVEAANWVSADEIILPDVLRDGEATIHSTCLPVVLNNVPPRNRFVVPQGNSWAEWWGCLLGLKRWMSDGFVTIGLAKHLERLVGGRARAVGLLVDAGLHLQYNIHMLGVWEDAWGEMRAAKEVWPGIRGVDTGLPVAFAQHQEVMVPGRRHSLSLEHVENEDLVVYNVALMDHICNGGGVS